MNKLLLNFICIAALMAPKAALGQIEFESNRDVCTVEACTQNMIKIDYRPHGAYSDRTPIIDTARKWSAEGVEIKDKKRSVTITSPKFKATIIKEPFSLVISDPDGKILLAQQAKPDKTLAMSHNAKDNMYGLVGYNRDVNQGIQGITRNAGGKIHAEPQGGCGGPFIWSTSGYGVLLDTDGGEITNQDGVLAFEGCSKKNFEYYIIIGTPREIIHSAGLVAGMPQLFPKWNCGFGQLEWGINEAEFKTHIAGYRERKIPFDWFMLDFDWMDWGGDNYGEFRWGPNFPSGPGGGMKAWSENSGVRITGITKPRIIAKNADGTFTQQGKDAEERGYWYPGEDFFRDYASGKPSKDLQFALPEVRSWWWGHLRDGGFDKGVVGFLNDECDDSNAGGLYSLGNFTNLHMQQSIYEGQRAHCNTRVWSVNRTGYLGSQRYAYSIWSGDNYPNFPDLQTQTAKLLTANNVLMPIWGFCATAFWDTEPVTPELYIRSVQTAFFAPLFFLHGTINQQKQPWFFGEQVVDATREVVNLRYRLIPYIYAYDRIKHETMLGLSRALIFDYPNDPRVADMSETFMFGDYLLASPVMEAGIAQKEIYMPAGTWIGFSNGTVYEGGKTHTIPVDNKTYRDMPLFIKQGAIIPTQEIVNYIGEKQPATIQIDVFPSASKTSFPLYDDDGETYDYESGKYFKQVIRQQDMGDYVSLSFANPEGTYTPSFDSYVIDVHYRSAQKVAVGQKALTRFENVEQLMNSEADGYCVTKDRYGVVTRIKTALPLSDRTIKVEGKEQNP